jgi:hypothetical protein
MTTFQHIKKITSQQFQNLVRWGKGRGREYELMTEAQAKLSVVRNCSRSSPPVCLGEGEQLAGGGRSAVAGGGGRHTVHREREFGAV